jgi:glycosyltransferase involved in cell wall biosynthesis
MTVLNRKPTVSIITVCYNSEKTIEDTIQSVISQDYPSIEYIVVDGKSTDKTLDIISKYEANISKRISEPDKGIYDAMNKGISMAQGDIIGILNSDDIFASATIVSDVVNAFISDPAIDAVYGNITYFKDGFPNKSVRTWITKPYYAGFYDTIGTYFPEFKITSDYEFMLRAFKIHGYKPHYLNKFIVNMRMGGASTKNFKNILTGNKEIISAWKMNNLRPPVYFWLFRFTKKVMQYINR